MGSLRSLLTEAKQQDLEDAPWVAIVIKALRVNLNAQFKGTNFNFQVYNQKASGFWVANSRITVNYNKTLEGSPKFRDVYEKVQFVVDAVCVKYSFGLDVHIMTNRGRKTSDYIMIT
jgi:hypothetical protein